MLQAPAVLGCEPALRQRRQAFAPSAAAHTWTRHGQRDSLRSHTDGTCAASLRACATLSAAQRGGRSTMQPRTSPPKNTHTHQRSTGPPSCEGAHLGTWCDSGRPLRPASCL
jgi:hypothetical protein